MLKKQGSGEEAQSKKIGLRIEKKSLSLLDFDQKD
jgi:hypothetical protein